MHTINTESKAKKSTVAAKIFVLTAAIFILHSSVGCAKDELLEKARDNSRKSKEYYQQAVKEYKDLIAQGKDKDKLYFELGELYYQHGAFKEAIEVLKNSADSAKNKLIGISYYCLGNYTDALEVFNQEENGDNEYLYYKAMTCEKLNLFDQALALYAKIKSGFFSSPAQERMNLIEKRINAMNIKDADPGAYQIIQNAPAQSNYPDAGALVLYCNEKTEVTADGKEISDLHYLIKILNERGKERFSESGIEYDSTFEKVELVYARTIKPDGSISDVGSRYLRDVSKYMNFPLYSNARVFIISFPEVSEGSVIEYKVKVYRSQLVNKKDFVMAYPLQAQDPLIQADFSVAIPKGTKLNLKNLNEKYNDFAARMSPEVKEERNRMIYAWHFKNIPQIIPESNMPAASEINPAILLSTFGSWQEVYNWWWGLAKDKIKADKAIQDKVAELIKDKANDTDKARAIYNFCAQKIRYVAVEYGQAGYEPHYAADIFKNKYGDCKDQAILLVTMLKEAKIEAYPVLIATRQDYNLNADFPSMIFNHCIAALSIDNKLIFLDPTAETCSFQDLPADDQARKVLVVKPDGYSIEDTPLYPASQNFVKQRVAIKVREDESISAEKSIVTSGVYDQAQRYWVLYTQPELIKEDLKTKIQEISIGATLDGYTVENSGDLDQHLKLDYSFKGPEYFTVAGNLRIMPPLAPLDTSLVVQDKRKYALDLNFLDSKETIFEIAIPGTFVIKYMPESIAEDNPWFSFRAGYSFRNNKIYFNQTIQFKKDIIAQQDYLEFKKIFEGLATKLKQRIVLEKSR